MGVSPMNRHQVRAGEFRALADAATASAAASVLAHVREKFERSAEVWTKLAENEERQDEATHVYRGAAPLVSADETG
jgi:hypothetical protein